MANPEFKEPVANLTFLEPFAITPSTDSLGFNSAAKPVALAAKVAKDPSRLGSALYGYRPTVVYKQWNDEHANMKYQHIGASTAYANKSAEEIRWEDYQMIADGFTSAKTGQIDTTALGLSILKATEEKPEAGTGDDAAHYNTMTIPVPMLTTKIQWTNLLFGEDFILVVTPHESVRVIDFAAYKTLTQ